MDFFASNYFSYFHDMLIITDAISKVVRKLNGQYPNSAP